MADQVIKDPWYQFHTRLQSGRLGVDINGGFAPDGIGLSATIEKPPFYYGVVAFRLLIVCLFVDITFFWGEE